MIADAAVVGHSSGGIRQKREFRGYRTLRIVQDVELGHSERQIANELQIPKSTVHDEVSRFHNLEISTEAYAFFTSDEGMHFLQQLLDCLILFVHDIAGGGLRIIESILRTSGLDRFIAASPSTLGIRAGEMNQRIAEFGEKEQLRLAKSMPHRKLCVLEDETWLDQMHLVGMDAVSGFILVEEPAAKRDGQTWMGAMSRGLRDLNAEIVQITSDEGRGLVHHAEVLLGVHHSPDLFHVQREVGKGLAAPLSHRARSAEKDLQKAREALEIVMAEQDNALQQERAPGRPVVWEKRISAAASAVEMAERSLEVAVGHQRLFRQSLKGLSEVHHPIDVSAGTPRSPKEHERQLMRHFRVFWSIVEEADLPEYSRKAVTKAERVVAKMVETIRFVSQQWEHFVVGLELDAKEAWQVRAKILPAMYLERLAKQEKGKEKRVEYEAHSSHLLASVLNDTGVNSSLRTKWEDILFGSREQVQLFQRSSSALEGRNGRLSQIHANGRGIGKRMLRSLTVLANFMTKRIDDTTAAERFFGQKPDDLVQWVFKRMPPFARSRKTHRSPLRLAS